MKKHIKQEGSLKILSLKSFLIGPCRVGKTTARRRLTGEIKCVQSGYIEPSTAVDTPLTVHLHHPTERASVLLSDHASGWSCQGLEEQCRALCSAIMNSPDLSASINQPTASQPKSTHATHHITHQSQFKQEDPDTANQGDSMKQDASSQDEVTTALTKLVKKNEWESIREFLKGVGALTLLHIVDIGGQPEFHEILPLLLHGLSLNLIFFNASHDINHPYKVVYVDDSGSESSFQYNSEFTVKDVIERALSSILALQTEKYHNPAAILIGTHHDCLTDEASVRELEQSIWESFKNTDFIRKDVLCSINKKGEKKRYIHLLDNVSGKSEDIDELRQLIERIVHTRFDSLRDDIPTAALLLRLILHMKFDKHPGWCYVEDCVKIAENCGISREDLLKENGILDYLHNRFGTILYYRKLERLKKRVIVNTNAIMGPPSELFVQAFGAEESQPETACRIRETGEIPNYLMERACSSKKTSDDKIPTDEIVELLEARYILYKNARSSAAGNETVYFLPSVLLPDHKVAEESKSPVSIASLPYPPVLFLPSTGNVPLGQFSATAVKLSNCNHWTLVDTKRFKNRIQFYVKCGEDYVRVEFRAVSCHLELRIIPEEYSEITPRSMIQCRSDLCKCLTEVTEFFPHTKNVKWQIGFYCPHALKSGEQPHPACYQTNKFMLCQKKGCQNGVVPLAKEHKCWFDVSQSNLRTCTRN